MPIKIIALDPGVTTGYALGLIEDDKMLVGYDQAKFSHRELFQLLAEVDAPYVICESFEFRQKAREGLELFSCELIGVVKLFDAANLHMQTAAQGKGHYNDIKLKKMYLYIPGKDHGRDALRHLLHWYTFSSGYKFNKKQPIVLARIETILDKGEI